MIINYFFKIRYKEKNIAKNKLNYIIYIQFSFIATAFFKKTVYSKNKKSKETDFYN